MEPITTVCWDIFKNILSNRADAFLFEKKKGEPASRHAKPAVSSERESAGASVVTRRFKTFDAVYDLETILAYVEGPIVHLLVEDSPSTAYHLPGYVLESTVTGEWFVFSRGRLALQGNGGGHHNIEGVFSMLSTKNAKIGAWVVDKKLLDLFENGQALWPDIKLRAVPLLAFLSEEFTWAEIRDQFQALATKRPG